MQLDTEFVRSQFPAFKEPSLQGWAHFENAGGSYACGAVIDRLKRYYVANKVQPYAWSDASIEAGRQMDQARQGMADWLNVGTDEVIFGPSTTQNTYVLGQAFRQMLNAGDEVIVTNLDHEANVGAFRRLADEGFVVREWRIDPDTGELDLADLDSLLSERTRIVAFTHCSNVVGTFNPVREIADRAHDAGAIAVVDGVSFCGHGLPDVSALGADVYLFSLYKVYGPHQGVMTVRRELNKRLPNQGHFFNDEYPTSRLAPAGPDHAQIAASAGVIDYLETICEHHGVSAGSARERAAAVLQLFQNQEHRLLQPLLDFLDEHPRVRLIGRRDAGSRAPTVAVDTGELSPVKVAERLAERRIGASAGHFYARRCVAALGIEPKPGVLRLSFVHYTSEEEMERLLEALDEVL
ncbi:MAG: aminotransferase class V-fold PLP-dependent enzyme [Xanthomonadales bacterium]|nr:aminotransferase class V-fold PLP-dependent enzyme [Xanthomonadales bacterium]